MTDEYQTADKEFVHCYTQCGEDPFALSWRCFARISCLLYLRLIHEKYGKGGMLIECETGEVSRDD